MSENDEFIDLAVAKSCLGSEYHREKWKPHFEWNIIEKSGKVALRKNIIWRCILRNKKHLCRKIFGNLGRLQNTKRTILFRFARGTPAKLFARILVSRDRSILSAFLSRDL